MGTAAVEKTTLGRYDVLRHLASGGMAEVLLGRTNGIEGFERHVVIKRIRWDHTHQDEFVKMFLDEARLAASLHHQNIVQVHDIGEEDGEYFFTMEFVHGQDLQKLLKTVKLRGATIPLEHVVTIILGAASGLHFAHDHRGPDRAPLNLVHRDVSLGNILVGYDGSVKVTDFGIAKVAQRKAETQSGALKGKVAYMSPEQCTGKVLDRRSDVFALGIVLYELVTVRRLFKGESDYLTMSAIVSGEIPPPSTYRPDIPPGLEAIITKALSRAPADRYQSADEMRVALENLAETTRLRTSTTALSAYMKELYGDQPQPWLVDAAPPPQESEDFDGSASGIVGPESDAIRQLDLPASAEPSSLIARARNKAITTSPPLSTMIVDDDLVLPPRRSGAPWLAIGLAVVVAAVIAIVMLRRGGDEVAAASAPVEPEPSPATNTANNEPIATPTEPPPEPPAPPTLAAAIPNGAATGSAEVAPKAEKTAPTGTAVTRKPPVKKTPKPPEPSKFEKQKWDPKSLFLKKK